MYLADIQMYGHDQEMSDWDSSGHPMFGLPVKRCPVIILSTSAARHQGAVLRQETSSIVAFWAPSGNSLITSSAEQTLFGYLIRKELSVQDE